MVLLVYLLVFFSGSVLHKILRGFLGVSPDPNMFDAASLAVEWLPSGDITGLPHPVRMVNNPWATTGAVIVGVILVYKIFVLVSLNATTPWIIGFQDPATLIIIVHFYNHPIFFLVII